MLRFYGKYQKKMFFKCSGVGLQTVLGYFNLQSNLYKFKYLLKIHEFEFKRYFKYFLLLLGVS